jgi:hypothetical protein
MYLRILEQGIRTQNYLKQNGFDMNPIKKKDKNFKDLGSVPQFQEIGNQCFFLSRRDS